MYINFKNKEVFIWLKEYLQSFFLLGFVYAGIYFLNNALTGFLYLAPAAHLVHIPSGFKLLFVLMGRWAAAAAIACVAFLNAYFLMFEGKMILGLALACASGLAPLFTWLFFKHRLQIEENLENIRYKDILAMGLFFAVLNSALHQLIVFWSGEQSDFAKGFLIMGIGDLTGLYVVLIIIKFTYHFIPGPKSEA
jgi:integral membrane sensor domain MASE1